VRGTESDLKVSFQKIKALKYDLQYSQRVIFPTKERSEKDGSPDSDDLAERFRRNAIVAPSMVEGQRHVLFRRASLLLPFLQSVEQLMPHEEKVYYEKLGEVVMWTQHEVDMIGLQHN
jgi:hypothetical protein